MATSTLLKLTHDESPEIYLQEISLLDANDNYVNWLNDSHVNQYLETRHSVQSLSSIREFIEATIANPNEHLFTIRLSASNKHIGNIKLGYINHHHKTADISLFIGDKNSWGKGYASQAIKIISHYGLETLHLRKLCAGAYEPNIASTKAFLKAGYQLDGVLSNHFIFDGTPCDRVQVCLFNYN